MPVSEKRSAVLVVAITAAVLGTSACRGEPDRQEPARTAALEVPVEPGRSPAAGHRPPPPSDAGWKPPYPDFVPSAYALADGAPRPKPGELGGPLPGLTDDELARFEKGRLAFTTRFTPQTGLGPYFEESSCSDCHHRPTLGGEAAAGRMLFKSPGPPPELETLHHPPHALAGFPPRPPPPDSFQMKPPKIYGLGLLDRIPDEVIIAGCESQKNDPNGVRGKANIDSNGVLGRFGLIAHERSLLGFAANALFDDLNVTSGTSDFHGQDDDEVRDPEVPDEFIEALADFVRFLAPPPREGRHPKGEALFAAIGCSTCHRPDTADGASGAYTDLCLHDMGPALAHGVTDKGAGPQDWRTPPLWGLRFQTRFLHDGRATSPDEAIRHHGGEAARARSNYLALAPGDRQAVLDFLGTL